MDSPGLVRVRYDVVRNEDFFSHQLERYYSVLRASIVSNSSLQISVVHQPFSGIPLTGRPRDGLASLSPMRGRIQADGNRVLLVQRLLP